MRRIVLLAMVLALPLVALTAPLAAPLCRVQGGVQRNALKSYTVTFTTRPECPENGYALVRMTGGAITPWRTVTPGIPAVFYRVPWYWRAEWQAASGKTYRIPLPPMTAPWENP